MPEAPVIWVQGATDSGCSVAILNAVAPEISQVLLDVLVPGVHVSLRFHPTIMAGQGALAISALDEDAKKFKGEYVLVLEGAVPTAEKGEFCTVGERKGKEIPLVELVRELAADAKAAVAMGTCASYGGIFAAEPNPTGCKGLTEVLRDSGIETPVVNLPGCPPHPDWFVTALTGLLLWGVPKDLDDVGRPRSIYGKLIHENCPRRPYFDAGVFAKNPSEPGCLFELGCRGPQAYADCPTRQWNGGVNWCIGAGAPCNGCVEPEYPDKFSPMYEKMSLSRLERFFVKTKS